MRQTSRRNRFASALVATLAFVCASMYAVPARARTNGDSKPATCPAIVRDVIDIGRGGTAGRQAYAVDFDSLSERSVRISGTLSLLAGEDRYDVPFNDALARGRTDKRATTPTVVRFRTAVHVDGAQLRSLRSPTSMTCLTLTRDVTEPQTAARIPAWFVALLERTQVARVIDAPTAHRETRTQCAVQSRAAYAKVSATPDVVSDVVASTLGGMTLEVPVIVLLSDSGSVLDARAAHPSKWPSLDAAAVDAARRSAFVPQVVRCRPQGGEYEFITTYGSAT